MKEVILQYLIENTEVEYRYTGGGEEPQIIVLKWSEDREVKEFLDEVATEIEEALAKKEA
jgi:hypothetical protein